MHSSVTKVTCVSWRTKFDQHVTYGPVKRCVQTQNLLRIGFWNATDAPKELDDSTVIAKSVYRAETEPRLIGLLQETEGRRLADPGWETNRLRLWWNKKLYINEFYVGSQGLCEGHPC